MSSGDLFQTETAAPEPLAERVRPQTLDDVLGQDHLTGAEAPLRKLIETDQIPSMIFWGPPGSGKTTLARVIANTTQCRFGLFSAVTSGVKEVRQVIARAAEEKKLGRRTILFIDEIHRFNRAQQDAFLPHMENGTIILIGATTENPSFEVNAALLSRARVFILNALDAVVIKGLLRKVADATGVSEDRIGEDALELITGNAEGDARRAINTLETVAAAANANGAPLTAELITEVLGSKSLLYDKSGEEHYNLISALHKSLRGSDPHATLYWVARMLASGEHPHYILRRMIRFASEDIGNADPRALSISLAARESYDFLGSPEGDLAIAQAAVYLATAPKSNAVYKAYGAANDDVQNHPNLPVPKHIRNAPTGLMKDLGYGAGYAYDHDSEHGYVPQDYLPDNLSGREYYLPTESGYEKNISALMDWWRELRESGALENGDATP
ncbi:TPA: AAA family ATPase [Candidatus Latescibacteria bacterium]|nr:AAA family ATPase [Candidatus Latescibacterota bacterium]